MARTIKEIYDHIIQEKQTFSELDAYLPNYESSSINPFQALLQDINSTSRIAIWRLWAFITAVALHYHEKIFDQHKIEVENIAANLRAGKLQWYAAEAMKFQYGYGITFNNNTYRYYYIDTLSEEAIASRIISKVSAKEVISPNFSGIEIKVAKNEGTELKALDELELECFKKYMLRIGFAGIPLSIVSTEADKVRYDINVYFDGVLSQSSVMPLVEQTIKDYLKSIEFDGILYKTRLIDALQVLSAVNDVEIVSLATQKPGADTWIDITNRLEEPRSGYFTAMPVGDLPGQSAINLISE